MKVPELAASMGLSTAPQLRFLKRQGKGARSAATDEQQQRTTAQPATGVADHCLVSLHCAEESAEFCHRLAASIQLCFART